MQKSESTKSWTTLPPEPGISFHKLKISWDARQEVPQLVGKLREQEPELDCALEALSSQCPVAASSRPFAGPSYSRPVGHARSFLLRLKSGGVLVFKGTEPLSDDGSDVLQEAWKRRPAFEYSRLEHFVLREAEIYLALTLKSAVFCAQQTSRFVADYLDVFGRLPRVPLPLMVYAFPTDVSEAFLDRLRPLVSDRGQMSAVGRLEELAVGGFGVYAYYYPTVPVRAAHAIGRFPGSGGIGIDGGAKSRHDFNVDEAVNGWIGLVADMLISGYLPTRPVHTGNCVQLQNLAVDGGLCDVDSVEHMSKVRDSRDFIGALFLSIHVLSESVAALIGGDHRIAVSVVWAGLWQEISRRVQIEPRRVRDQRLLEATRMDGLAVLTLLAEVA